MRLAQNFRPSGLSLLNFAQRIFLSEANYTPNSSSSALASFRSGVLKPSVNQP